MVGTALLAKCLGIARSLRMYYGDPTQVGRMERFYGQFIRPGELCFDIGAHVGSRIAPWLRLGARIVAVEPQPACVEVIRRLYGHSPNLRIVQAALGAAPGQQQMLVCDREPTISTLSTNWASTMQRTRDNFVHVRWNRSIDVRVATLDELIAEYGEPAFCKIDVEGYELEVLRGLSRPLRTLSLEYVPPALDGILTCIQRLAELGHYEYNWSPGESMRFALPTWTDAASITQLLRSIPDDANPGDVYARLTSG